MTEEEIIDKIFNEKEFLWNELNFEKNNGGVTYVQNTKILYSSF